MAHVALTGIRVGLRDSKPRNSKPKGPQANVGMFVERFTLRLQRISIVPSRDKG